jgi:hypothetical protein
LPGQFANLFGVENQVCYARGCNKSFKIPSASDSLVMNETMKRNWISRRQGILVVVTEGLDRRTPCWLLDDPKILNLGIGTYMF